MSSTSFSNGTVVVPAWLNDVNAQTYVNAANIRMPLYGATGNGTTDDFAAIQGAVDIVGAAGGGTIFLPRGVYKTSAPIIINYKNVKLVGESGAADHLVEDNVVEIRGDFAVGDVILVKQPGCSVENLTVSATATRQAGSALANNHGIRFEAIDNASTPSLKRSFVSRVRITQQPASGLVMIGDVLTSTLFMVDADQNGGHGIVINGGYYTGRVNQDRPGQINLLNCRASRNGGHGLLVGDANTSLTGLPYRVFVENFESFRNGQDAAVQLEDYDWFLWGENITINGSATGGETDTGVPGHGGIYLAGRSIYINNHRFIDDDIYCAYIADRAEYPTADVHIHAGFINNDNEAPNYYNPAFLVENTCENVHVIYHGQSVNVASLMSTSSNFFMSEEGESKRFDGIYTAGNFRSAASAAVLADDKAGYWTFSDITSGVAVISSNLSTTGNALVAFRVGTSNFCQLLSSSGLTVDVTTGTLANAGGTDGRVTISADSANNRLYISNRSGATGNYLITVLSASDRVQTFTNL